MKTCSRCTRPAVRGRTLCTHHREKARRTRENRAQRNRAEQSQLARAQQRADPKRNALLSKGKAAAIYVRTSTADQHPENQLPELRKLAAHNGLAVVEVYEEQASATRDRPAFERMMDEASQRGFNVLLVWALDRLGRSMIGVVDTVRRLDEYGCRLLSVREPWMDTKGPIRQLLTALFGWIAEQERDRIVERTRAGLQRARASGTQLGRRARSVDLDRMRELRGQGKSWDAIAADLGVGRGTLRRAIGREAALLVGRPKSPPNIGDHFEGQNGLPDVNAGEAAETGRF
jgi:putative DNA-invertase from lambdoid prophage Rac